MKRAHLRWLNEELPDLVKRGVLTDEAAERLRAHYARIDEDRPSTALMILGVLGAALIGAGVILLLAHNWEDLTRAMRAAIAIGLMIVAQAVAGWTLWRRAESPALREAVSTFWVLALAACVALVGQTYNLGGSYADLLLACTLLSLPVLYLMRACTPGMLYWIGIGAWCGFAASGSKPLFWLLAILAVPHLVAMARESRRSARVAWLYATVALVLLVSSLPLMDPAEPFGIPYLAALAGALYAAGRSRLGGEAAWKAPVATISMVAIGVLSVFLTYEFPWRHLSQPHTPKRAAAIGAVTIAFVAMAYALLDAWRAGRERRFDDAAASALPLVALGAWLAALAGQVEIALLTSNLYLLALGLLKLLVGLRESKLSTANVGLLLLAALFAVRFFDSDLSFVLRGVGFILLGAAFLAVNVVLLQRRRRLAR